MAEPGSPRAAAARAAVRPRLAASLVLVRESGHGPELLLGRRNRRHAFLPGLYVFPGGAAEREDADVPGVSEPLPEVRRALERRLDRRRARALAVAAVRETLEETGMLVGAVGDDGLRPDLAALRYVARAITPAALPVRYDARFFAARVDGAAHSDLQPSGELLDLRWVALHGSDADLPMLDVTRFVIRCVRELHGWRQPERVPLHYYRAGQPLLRHD